MRIVSLIVGLLVSTTALALDITPTANQPVCLQRVYTAEHMAKNPKQKLSELTVKLKQVTYTAEDNQPYTYDIAQIVGRNKKDNALYGNTAGCTFNADGSANCAIECDGGSFALKQRPSWINFEVTPDYYFPLFKGVLEPDIENTPVSVDLDGNDKDNNVFRLENVPVEKCDDAISKVQEMDGGC